MQGDKNVNKKGFSSRMRGELKKVIWPTGEQTMKSTFVTIAFVLIISLVLIALNVIFGGLNKLWINSLPSNNVIINSSLSDDNSGDNIVLPNASGDEHDHEHEHLSGDIVPEKEISGEMLSGE